ncbi:Uncharacterised protein [Mycobacteroides abscessus subsp. abscessus]|nr:Uncharacterised protein [Mycobacteroides abscessus subsp. abscessus]
MPTSCTSARSFRVPTPNSQMATTMSESTGMAEMRLVLMERMNVWFTAKLACSAYVRREVCWKPWVFSSTLSNTITVSYKENPRIVSRPITVAGVTSKPTREYTPAVTSRSKTSAASAASDM